MDAYERMQQVLKRLEPVLPFMVNGEEHTMTSLAEDLYAVINDEYQRGYDQGFLDGADSTLDGYRENTWSTPPSGEVRTGQ